MSNRSNCCMPVIVLVAMYVPTYDRDFPNVNLSLLLVSSCIAVVTVAILSLLSLLIVIGFVESAYTGEERGEDHSVLAGYISGLPDNRVITYAITSITASE